jgi:NAD(P)-dependent dehydrogenase (short-subunit alcohol dehydrogenase family)
MVGKRLYFSGRVAVVTGSGRGIGQAHAELLAARGATVVVNDAGIEVDGTHASKAPATEAVEQIRRDGGTAVTSFQDISGREASEELIDWVLGEFGRIDIIVHNAGLNIGPLNAIWNVNVGAAWWMTERAWPAMAAERFGRIVLTTSASGLYADGSGPLENPKQAYSTTKAAVLGLTRSLALRGAPVDIKVNAVSPKASTRLAALNRGISSTRPGAPGFSDTLDWGERNAPPAAVAAGTLWLLHDTCPVTGSVFAVGAGRVAEVFTAVNRGYISQASVPEPEEILEHLTEILDRRAHYVPLDMIDHSTWTRDLIDQARSGGAAGESDPVQIVRGG